MRRSGCGVSTVVAHPDWNKLELVGGQGAVDGTEGVDQTTISRTDHEQSGTLICLKMDLDESDSLVLFFFQKGFKRLEMKMCFPAVQMCLHIYLVHRFKFLSKRLKQETCQICP